MLNNHPSEDLPEITSRKVKIVWDRGLFYCPYIPDISDNVIEEFIAKSGLKTRKNED
jgi:hypothetical protein